MNPLATRNLGRTGVALTQLGFGAAHLGELYATVPESQAQDTIGAAFDAGIAYFDTSPWYGRGLSEHRLGRFLRGKRRDSFVLSTKVGRVLFRPADPETFDTSPWRGGLGFDLRFDYTADGLMRSYEDSIQRLGLNRIDLLLIHDVDSLYHGDDVGRCIDQLANGGGWAALEALRSSGEIKGIGAGINEPAMIPRFLDRFDIDFFLVAMPYTLLDQDVLEVELPRCAERDVGVVIGAPYASGILATGPTDAAMYAYARAEPETKDRVRRLHETCGRFEVPLKAAALQFPLGQPCVAAVIPGAVSAAEVADNLDMARTHIPSDLWAALKSEGLLPAAAPTP